VTSDGIMFKPSFMKMSQLFEKSLVGSTHRYDDMIHLTLLMKQDKIQDIFLQLSLSIPKISTGASPVYNAFQINEKTNK
jgi:hypothetical protein